MAPKVLIILTSVSKMGSGDSEQPTGWFLPELSHPYDELTAAGIETTFASPAGGEAPLDPGSVEMFKEDPSSINFKKNNHSLYENTVTLASIADTAASDFDAVFYPGGHGPMFDLATDATSRRIAAAFAEKGKPVAAVCHGPAALVNVTLSSGEHLLKGKRVTGFSNSEEDSVQKSKLMPFMLETKLGEVSGGKYEKAKEDWGAHVIVDGLVITGQNPNSAKGVGEALVKALSK